MSRKKSTSTAAPKKGERLILDRIMNTRDPHMKETYFRLFDEEWERSGYTPHTQSRSGSGRSFVMALCIATFCPHASNSCWIVKPALLALRN